MHHHFHRSLACDSFETSTTTLLRLDVGLDFIAPSYFFFDVSHGFTLTDLEWNVLTENQLVLRRCHLGRTLVDVVTACKLLRV